MWPRALHVYLEQLSSTHNVLDGAPSTLLNLVHCPVRGLVAATLWSSTVHTSNHYKSGTINELNIRVTNGQQAINNHNLPISLVLEVV